MHETTTPTAKCPKYPKRPSGYLSNGLRVSIRKWPCLLSACVIVIAVGLIACSPLTFKIAPQSASQAASRIESNFAAGMAAARNPNQLSRKIAGNLNAAHLKDFTMRVRRIRITRDTVKFNRMRGRLCFALLGFAALLFLTAGTLPMYFGEGPPRFRALLEGGRDYFWRFVRVLILASTVSLPLLAGVITLGLLLLRYASRIYNPHAVFICSVIAAGMILFFALLLLLWADLVEVYTVRNGTVGNRRVRQALLPALRLLHRQFLWILPSFLLPGVLGACLAFACFFLCRGLFRSHHLWLVYVAGQTGVLLLLAARFWQRGMETSLVSTVDRLATAAAVLNQLEPKTGMAEPSLQDLVLKLKGQPWAKQDSAAVNSELFPEAGPLPTAVAARQTTQESLLAQHARKITLLDALTEEAAPSAPAELSAARARL